MPLSKHNFDGGDRPYSGERPSAPYVHPLAATGYFTGRVITVLEPDGYILVDGLLVRATLTTGYAGIGDEVEVNFHSDGRVLDARGADEPPDRGPVHGGDMAVSAPVASGRGLARIDGHDGIVRRRWWPAAIEWVRGKRRDH